MKKQEKMSVITESLRKFLGRGQPDSINPNSQKLAQIEAEKKKKEEEAAKYSK